MVFHSAIIIYQISDIDWKIINDSPTSTEMEPSGRVEKDMLDSWPMSENASEALVKADPQAAIHAAIEFWAEGSTRAETFERASKLRDKTRAGLYSRAYFLTHLR